MDFHIGYEIEILQNNSGLEWKEAKASDCLKDSSISDKTSKEDNLKTEPNLSIDLCCLPEKKGEK